MPRSTCRRRSSGACRSPKGRPPSPDSGPQERPRFFAEPEVPFADKGPGYYALVRHADVVEASRLPDVFCSGQGATNIADLPVEFNEYFGSMINMDDPRHARLRRIVSRAFSPADDRQDRRGRPPRGR